MWCAGSPESFANDRTSLAASSQFSSTGMMKRNVGEEGLSLMQHHRRVWAPLLVREELYQRLFPTSAYALATAPATTVSTVHLDRVRVCPGWPLRIS